MDPYLFISCAHDASVIQVTTSPEMNYSCNMRQYHNYQTYAICLNISICIHLDIMPTDFLEFCVELRLIHVDCIYRINTCIWRILLLRCNMQDWLEVVPRLTYLNKNFIFGDIKMFCLLLDHFTYTKCNEKSFSPYTKCNEKSFHVSKNLDIFEANNLASVF